MQNILRYWQAQYKERKDLMGKVIVIEGSDGSGKATQAELLYNALIEKGVNVRKVSFPNYDSPSSALVRMYLSGELTSDPYEVNSYVASSFYAVDRFATYLREWKDFYGSDPDAVVICDRYVTSNMLHQAAKFDDLKEKEEFLDWEYDFEYMKGGLPVPDRVFFLDVDPEVSMRLMKERENKFSHEAAKDIHESDPEFLRKSYENCSFLCDKYGWVRIRCCDENGEMKTPGQIHDMIMDKL